MPRPRRGVNELGAPAELGEFSLCHQSLALLLQTQERWGISGPSLIHNAA